MAIYKYYIDLVYLAQNETIYIPKENVRKLFIDHNYAEANMPTMYCTLNIDKALYDRIIMGAKTDEMLLTVYKINTEANTNIKEVVYNAKCEYFLKDDINYNRDIDYKDDSNKKDVYREVYIGLMFKAPIEWNKQTNNTTFVDSTMMNIVGSFTDGVPLLVEPFTYNDTFDQLIVPPQDSLTKTIDFLNDVKVFYDTQYRVFYEPDCMYLVSSSGKATPKNTDEYETVKFIVYTPDDINALVQGMSKDDTQKAYLVNINSLDTVYNIDTYTRKKFNSISSIINPSKENSLETLSSMQSVIGDINNIASSLRDVAKVASSVVQEVPAFVNKLKSDFKLETMNVNGIEGSSIQSIDQALAKIMAMPEPESSSSDGPTEKTLSAKDKERVAEILNQCKIAISGNTASFNGINKDYDEGMGGIFKILGNINQAPSYLTGVTAINAQANLGPLKGCFGDIEGDSKKSATHTNDKLKPYVNVVSEISAAAQKAIDAIASTGIESEKVVKFVNVLYANKQAYDSTVKMVAANIAKFSDLPNKFKGINDQFKPYGEKLSNIKVNLKAQFTALKTDINTLGKNAKSMLKQISESGKNAINKLKSTGLSLKSLKQLRDDIHAIRDISGIGKLGISKFDFNLNLGGNGTGTTIYNIPNDNANKLKNIKSELESKVNTFILNKNDLDVSVLNINMRYIIKNFDTHSDKDGAFILDRKVEIFMRSDDKFICNCRLHFRKLIDDAAAGEVPDTGQEKALDPEKAKEVAKAAKELLDDLKDSDIINMMSNGASMGRLEALASGYENTTKGEQSNKNMAAAVLGKIK
jgi:hypothetical protein|nr:MAG TPA: hypothetical protein [Caudoviricetes sp.]